MLSIKMHANTLAHIISSLVHDSRGTHCNFHCVDWKNAYKNSPRNRNSCCTVDNTKCKHLSNTLTTFLHRSFYLQHEICGQEPHRNCVYRFFPPLLFSSYFHWINCLYLLPVEHGCNSLSSLVFGNHLEKRGVICKSIIS